MSLNIQGHINNYTELKFVIKKRKPDICFLNETHMTNDINNAEIKVSGYNTIRCNSHSNRTGGVTAYVKNNIQTRNVNSFASSLLWVLSFDIQTNLGEMTICGVYLNSSSDKTPILNEFEQWCDTVPVESNISITGDFNVNFLTETDEKKRLSRMCDDLGWKQIINSPTRVSAR